MTTGFKGLASTVMGALMCAALASCTALAPSDEPGTGTGTPDMETEMGVGNPDLMVASVSVSDSRPATGAPFALSATVRNAGDGASEPTTLRYYQSPDVEITSSDTVVGTGAVAGLAASGTSGQSVSLTAPTTAGTYYYGACVDAVEGESDTTNNCSSSTLITVPEPEPGPNLAVSPPSVSNSAPAVGTTFTVSALVRNDGDEASVVTTMRFYRSTDATITTSDTEVGTATVEGTIPFGNQHPVGDEASAGKAGLNGGLGNVLPWGAGTGRTVDSWNVLFRRVRGLGKERVRHDQQLLVLGAGHGADVGPTGSGHPGPESLQDRNRIRD